MKTKRKAWTDAEVERLRAGYAANEPRATIAKELGRTARCVLDKASSLGLSEGRPASRRALASCPRWRQPRVLDGLGQGCDAPARPREPDCPKEQARLARARQLAVLLKGGMRLLSELSRGRPRVRDGDGEIAEGLARHIAAESPGLVRLLCDRGGTGVAVELTDEGRRVLLNEEVPG